MRPETSLSRREKNEKHAYMGRLVLKLSPYIYCFIIIRHKGEPCKNIPLLDVGWAPFIAAPSQK